MSNKGKLRTAYLKDKRGTVAPVFGLMAIPMLAITGGAIDIGQAITAEKNLQNALDSATVAVCGGGTGQQTSEEILRSFLKAELANTQLKLQPPADPTQVAAAAGENDVELSNTAFDAATGSLSPTVKTRVPTTLLKLVGINEIEIEASSSVKCGAKRLELSVVLDVTGSMDWNAGGRKKIDSMKDAATDLLDIFERNMDAGVTKIGLVPFSESVRLPTSLLPAVRDYPSHTYRFKKRGGNQWRTYNLTDCVTERNGNHRFTDDAPGPGRWLNPMYSSNGNCRPAQSLIPMTTDHAQLQTVIDGLSPAGGTAGHLGTGWGWYMLSPKWQSVWPEGSKPEDHNEDELIKATIIMTDGDYNTEYCHGVNDSTINCNSPNGTSKAQAAELCTRMKQTGVVVYAIGFGISSGSSQETLLKDCATDDTKWFFPYDGEQLRAAFVTIGKQLSGGQAGKAIVQQ